MAVTALSFAIVEEELARKTARQEDKRVESFLLRDDETDLFTTRTEATVLRSEEAGDPPEGSSDRQGEGEDAEAYALSFPTGPVSTGSVSAGLVSTGLVSTGEANSEREASAHVPFEEAQTEFSFFSPTLGLEPKPAWVKTPVQRTPPMANTTDPRRLVYRPRLPIRPLHKQRFDQRILFYLRGWLRRRFRKTV